jgi:hypothetical protein
MRICLNKINQQIRGNVGTLFNFTAGDKLTIGVVELNKWNGRMDGWELGNGKKDGGGWWLVGNE